MANDISNVELIILEEHNNIRLDKFLSLSISDISRAKLQSLIKLGEVILNGDKIKSSSIKVRTGDHVKVKIVRNTTSSIPAKKIELNVVYEDKDIIVINKPIGLTVHPGAGNKNDTLVNALVYHCKGSLSKIGGDARPGIVHRLDRDTSGLMVIAKNDRAHEVLSEAIKNREVRRVYNALIYGTLHPHIGSIKTGFGRSKKDRTRMAVMRDTIKQAITHYKVLKEFGAGKISLVQFQLETGRTHQIRVHMEHKRTPIIGDKTYGKAFNQSLSGYSKEAIMNIKGFPRQALHAVELSFEHPTTGELLSFLSELPNDISQLIKLIDV